LEKIHDRERGTQGPSNIKIVASIACEIKIHIFLTGDQWILSKFEPNIHIPRTAWSAARSQKLLKKKGHYFWTKLAILGADRRELERIDIVDSM